MQPIKKIYTNKKTILIYWNVIISHIEQKEIPEEDFNYFDLKYLEELKKTVKKFYKYKIIW